MIRSVSIQSAPPPFTPRVTQLVRGGLGFERAMLIVWAALMALAALCSLITAIAAPPLAPALVIL